MPLFRGCSALVIRCFKRVEHFADWITGAAGPVFVFLAWVLIVSGGLIFFDTVARDLSWPLTILLSPILILAPLNLYGQYYLVTHVPSGFPSSRALAKSDRPMNTVAEKKWIRTATTTSATQWLRPERWGMFRARGGWSGWEHGGVSKTRNSSSDTISISMSNSGKDTDAGTGEGKGKGKRKVRRCRKCDAPKPVRTHHCSVCKRCVLLMDHHCPWINGCVGLNNQRHFILFMAWLCIACYVFALLGWKRLWLSFGLSGEWASYTPRLAYTLIYILAIAIGLSVNVLCAWHLYMVSKGETSIESHDNSYLENKAASEGLIYINQWDLGRKRNLEFFFNVGPLGYPSRTLLFPLLVPPASDGWSFPRRAPPASTFTSRSSAGQRSSGTGVGYASKVRPDPAEADLTAAEQGGDLRTDLSAVAGAEAEAGVVGYRAEEGFGDGSRYLMDNGDTELTDDEEGGGGWMELDDDEEEEEEREQGRVVVQQEEEEGYDLVSRDNRRS